MDNNYNLAQAVGKRTEQLLYKTKTTQYRLGKITCLSEKTLRDLIKGKTSDVKISTIYLIANAFDLSLNEFFDSEIFDKNKILI